MELFTQLFDDVLAFVYHCFDRIVIYGYLSGLSRPEQVVHFFRNIVGVATVSKEVLSQRTADYQAWVEAYARNHRLPIDWAEKGVRKEDHVLPWQHRMTRQGLRCLFYLQEHGAGRHLSRHRAEIPDQRSQLGLVVACGCENAVRLAGNGPGCADQPGLGRARAQAAA
jgi:hypothetical protein